MVYVLCLAGRRPGLAKVSNGLALVMKDKFRGTPLRDVAGRHKISRSALSRHMPHIGQAIIKAQERREERLADNVFDGISSCRIKPYPCSVRWNRMAITAVQSWQRVKLGNAYCRQMSC